MAAAHTALLTAALVFLRSVKNYGKLKTVASDYGREGGVLRVDVSESKNTSERHEKGLVLLFFGGCT